jgi:hypothetical protein
MKDSGMMGMMKNKVREIVFSEREKNSEMNECERDMIVGCSFMMKCWSIEKELLLKLWKCLIVIVKEGISNEKKKEVREGLIGLKCICGDDGFFLFSFSLCFFFIPLLCLIFFFSFIIFLVNRDVLRDTSIVSEMKKISSEYEREVERRGKGEIVKRKVDKISLAYLLQIEFMLIKEDEEKKKFVKNNLLPVLPFLLSGEEKEREEDSEEEDIENGTVFKFLSSSVILNDNSLRSLLLSDERKLLLNKTLLFSLRRDSPFTRRECLDVLLTLFFYGREICERS